MSTKHALLIGSPYGGLMGTNNDVDLMEEVLRCRGFGITRCCGDEATQDGIIGTWKSLIERISSRSDAVVIYYSGHGGLVEFDSAMDQPQDTKGTRLPHRHQFIVPADYGLSKKHKFKGILTVEIADVIRKTTDKTENVTVILDCCHSGRMARDPYHGDNARARTLFDIPHADLTERVNKLLEERKLERWEGTVKSNPHAVRIAAAATSETAYECQDDHGRIVGIFTKYLAAAIGESNTMVGATNDSIGRDSASWSTMLRRVRELVNAEFCGQHPQVEGPSNRRLFSTEEFQQPSFLVKMEGAYPVIQAGRVAGVKEGNTYIIQKEGGVPTEAKVTKITGFKSRVTLEPPRAIHYDGELATLQTEAPYRWPVSHPKEPQVFFECLEKSRFLRTCADDHGHIARIQLEGVTVQVVDRSNTLILEQKGTTGDASRIIASAVSAAEDLARAQHLLTLESGKGSEELDYDLHIDIGLVRDGEDAKNAMMPDGQLSLNEGDDFFIRLHNTGKSDIFVTVFDVNVAGEIELLSDEHPFGINLGPGKDETIGSNVFGELEGMTIQWPNTVPRQRAIPETLVFVVTEIQVDLSHFSRQQDRIPATRGDTSALELLAHHLAYGFNRKVKKKTSAGRTIKYDVRREWFTLVPRSRT